MELDLERFTAAIQKGSPEEIETELKSFIEAHPVLEGINVQTLISIAKMICSGASVVCPIINNL